MSQQLNITGSIKLDLGQCVKCGFCCRQGPCAFGKWDRINKRCRYLTMNNECEIYEKIISIPQSIWNPAFGKGCCSKLNTSRKERLEELKNALRS